MALFRFYWRLFLTTFWQRPLRFRPAAKSLKGLIVVVTGGNAGIGYETAFYLASHGARVIISSRSEQRGVEAVVDMQKRAGQELDLHCYQLDLSDLASVQHFASRVQAVIGSKKLDVLINNAGLMNIPYQTSKQGHEMTFATNHLGHFLLTRLLIPIMPQPGGRVVIVSAELHTLATDASPDYKYGDSQDAYNRSKLANIWHAYELQRREPGLVVPVLHPGVINTNLGHYGSVVSFIKRLLFLTPEQGAWTTLFCSLADGVQGNTYYHNSLGVVPTSPLANDKQRGQAMWDLSERLVKDFTR